VEGAVVVAGAARAAAVAREARAEGREVLGPAPVQEPGLVQVPAEQEPELAQVRAELEPAQEPAPVELGPVRELAALAERALGLVGPEPVGRVLAQQEPVVRGPVLVQLDPVQLALPVELVRPEPVPRELVAPELVALGPAAPAPRELEQLALAELGRVRAEPELPELAVVPAPARASAAGRARVAPEQPAAAVQPVPPEPAPQPVRAAAESVRAAAESAQQELAAGQASAQLPAWALRLAWAPLQA
jgi:hypothetical protein